jgi:hypothetical protein
MTPTNEALELEASRIRAAWAASARNSDPRSPADERAAKIKAHLRWIRAQGREPGTQDVGALTALGFYGEPVWALGTDERERRRKVIEHIKHRDPTGLSGPDQYDLQAFPDLLKIWREQSAPQPGSTHADGTMPAVFLRPKRGNSNDDYRRSLLKRTPNL